VAVEQRIDEVLDTISRCASAVGDPARLRLELQALRDSSDSRAQLACLLFELDLARHGDPQARSSLPALAEGLLGFWRSGSGEALAAVHPALEELWTQAASLVASFEVRRFEQALARCWEARHHAPSLERAIPELQPEGNRRVEFARCLYHLELARLAVDASRAEFARRAGLLAEAYQDPAVARELVGSDEGLAFLWQELVPYLDEFFETLEEAAEKGRRARADAEAAALEAVARAEPEPTVSLAAQRTIPSFRTLIGQKAGALPAPPITPVDHPGLGAEEPAPEPLPPPSRDTLDEDGEVILEGVELDGEEGAVTPPPAQPPPPPRGQSHPTPHLGLSSRPTMPDRRPPEPRPDQATNAFWLHTFSSLELLPGDAGRSARILASESRAERKRLSEFVDSLAPHLQVPEARAMACLLSLMLAGQTKEKNLFGQPNPRRADALRAALPYISTNVAAAAHVAVWFELDGPQTRAALGLGLALLVDFLGYCHRQGRDPLDHGSVEAFTRA
jgi:hypothetical protein